MSSSALTFNMKVKLIDEYNDKGHLIFIENFIGAYIRGKTFEECVAKLHNELMQYAEWRNIDFPNETIETEIIQKKQSDLNIGDADSDIIFESEKKPLTQNEYENLKALALKSANDFLSLYLSVPDKNATCLLPRETFYGKKPLTANEMYEHTKNVNSYYFSEIGINADNKPDIYTCRLNGFKKLETKPDFLKNKVLSGSYDELWSLRKLLRRFIWHDRIHAKAMYRMATKLFGNSIDNSFKF